MLEQTCRTCLATCGELVPIFSDDYYVHNLPEKLFHTTRIEVQKDDDLPKMMCKKCIFLVDSLFCFKDQCEMAEIKLKKTLRTSKEIPVPTINISGLSNNVLVKDDENSDSISSEEDYQIEYASEEARLEVENARKRSRNARSKHKRNSGVVMKTIAIIPAKAQEDGYDNPSSCKYEQSEIDEDTNITDSDDLMSLYASEDSRRISSTTKKENYTSVFNFSSKPSSTSTFAMESYQKNKTTGRPTFKRKSEESDNCLSKQPKKVLFKPEDYEDENVQYIEISENKTKKDSDMTLNHENSIEVNENQNLNTSVSFNTSQSQDLMYKNDDDVKSSENDSKKVIELRMHNLIKNVVLNMPEICPICQVTFDSHIDVLKHKIQVHLSTDQEYYFCLICHKKSYSSSNLVDHLEEHKNISSYICILCSGSFYTMETLRSHLSSHVNLYDLQCQMCSKKFHRIQSLLLHLKSHLSTQQLTCTLCSQSFKNKTNLQNHVSEEHSKSKSKCKICEIEVPENEMVEHVKSHTGFPCPYCEHNFTTKTSLRDHVFTHLGVQQYTCLVCNKSFSSQDDRTQHMQEHLKPQISDRKKFRCRVCHEILVSRSAYGHHLKEKHWNCKQTAEILRELSEASLNEKFSRSTSNSISSE